MRQFVLPGEPRRGRIEIGGRDFHYLVRVRRLRPGGSFLATDGRGRRWRCTVGSLGRQSLELELAEEGAAEPRGPRITLVQALPKSRKMDLIVRQVTEAGVSVLLPVLSRHSLVRVEGGGSAGPALAQRRERWQRIAREAVQQSGRALSPVIGAIVTLPQAVEGLATDAGLRLLAHQEPLGGKTLHECLAGPVAEVILAVGPEGGFAAEEIELLRGQGFLPVNFTGTVLRTETAALFAVAAVQIVLQEKEAWRTSR